MKTMFVAIIFLMVLGISLGIYNQSSTAFNLSGATLTYSTTNQVVINGGGAFNNTITNATSNPGGCASVVPGLCSFQLFILNGVSFIECQLGNTASCAPNSGSIAQVAANQLQSTSPGLPGIPPLITTNALASSNAWFQLFSNPLDSAITIMGIFLGLGILAGLLGAGILARVMASVGIGLAAITYIEGSLGAFGALPALIYIGFNGIIGILLLIIAWESFNAPGAAG